jgi:hypothetical protein
MTPAAALAAYRRALGQFETIVVRRWSGTGAGRTKVEATAPARPLSLQSADLVGAIAQGKSQLVVLNDPDAAVGAGYVSLASLLPLDNDDKIVFGDRELAITAVDANTRRISGVTIALNIDVEG